MQFFLEIDLFGLERRKQKETRNIFQQKVHSLYPHSQRLRNLFLYGNIGMTFDVCSEFSLIGGPVLVLSMIMY